MIVQKELANNLFGHGDLPNIKYSDAISFSKRDVSQIWFHL